MDPQLAYSIRSRGVKGAPRVTDQATPFSLLPGRMRTAAHGSLRRLWSSWYASLSAPLSTWWPRATPSAVHRRSTQWAKWTEILFAVPKPPWACDFRAPTTPSLMSTLLPADTPPLSASAWFPSCCSNLFMLNLDSQLLLKALLLVVICAIALCEVGASHVWRYFNYLFNMWGKIWRHYIVKHK